MRNVIEPEIKSTYSTEINTVSELVKIVKESVGDDVNLIFSKTDDNRSYHISSDKIKDELNFHAKHSINEAVLDLVTAFKNKILIDCSLSKYKTIYAAAGHPNSIFAISYNKLVKITDGIISSRTGYQGDITKYQISAPIQGGNSGGPLFDEYANLIGINSSGLKKYISDNVGYSIKASYLMNLIDVLPEKIKLPSSSKLANQPLTEQIKLLSDYVVLIKIK